MRAGLIQWGTQIGICWSLLTSLAKADDGLSTVEIRCEALSREQESELEARLLGELLVNGLQDAQMTLSCEPEGAQGSLLAEGRSKSVESAEEKDPGIEGLYQLATQLIDLMLEPTPTVEQQDAAGESDANGSSEDQALLSDVTTSAPDEQKHAVRGAIGAGLALQIVGGEEAVLLGPRLDGEIEFLSSVGVRLEAAFYFPTHQAGGFALQDFRTGAAFYFRPVSWWRVGAFASISVVRARGPDEFAEGTTHSVRPALGGFTEASWAFTHWEPYLGLGVSWVNARRVLEVDGEVRSELPAVQGLINVGARFRIGGS